MQYNNGIQIRIYSECVIVNNMCIMSYNCSVKSTIDAINVVCAIYEMPSEILFIIVSWKQLLDFG